VSKNDYWLSTNPDVLQYSKTTWWHTPCSSYSDFTQLQSLAQVTLDTNSSTVTSGNNYITTVNINNPSKTIAFLIHVRLVRNNVSPSILDPADVTPLFWDDNYITLFPGETQILTGTYTQAAAGNQPPQVVVELFNNMK